jgi:hypothetical protein
MHEVIEQNNENMISARGKILLYAGGLAVSAASLGVNLYARAKTGAETTIDDVGLVASVVVVVGNFGYLSWEVSEHISDE